MKMHGMVNRMKDNFYWLSMPDIRIDQSSGSGLKSFWFFVCNHGLKPVVTTRPDTCALALKFDIKGISLFLKQIAFSLVLLLTAYSSFAQYPTYKALSDLPAFKKEFSTQSEKISSITSTFVQEKILTALTEKITSEGKFWFKRSNKVKIEYIKPFHYTMTLNGDKMKVKDDQKENTINVKSNKLFQQVNRIIVDCVQGTILDSKDFTTRVFENENSYLLEMTPSSKSLKEFFQTIVLVVEKKDYTVKSIEMNEPSGDKTLISFFNKKLNEQISDEIFAL